MEERRVADYFVVAGLPEDCQLLKDEETTAHLKPSHNQAPITDVAVIFPSLGETVPDGFTVIETTPTGLSADLNHGSIRSPEVFLCYRRGRDKPPLIDIGVMYDGKERILADSEIVKETPTGYVANVNNSTARTFVTFRRAQPTMPCNALVVTDICVVITSKGEDPPHAFNLIQKNLNKGLVGSDVYLCYKKSMNRTNLITYTPGIVDRYPETDQGYFMLPPSVPLFCLPMGATLEAWPTTAQEPLPVFSTFVLTVSDGVDKVYGSAITFYEKYPEDKVTEEQRELLNLKSKTSVTFHVNKCICLLSHWPFFDTFEKFLLFLHGMVKNSEPHSVPIERYITHLLEDVPFPSIHRPRILVQLSSHDRLILTQPEDLPLPRSGAGFRQLLFNLGPDNCMLVLVCALTEQKLLIHSLRPDVLTAVAEAVSMIIFPFKWQCPYIPLCPLSLVEVLHAPLPFLIGVDSRFFNLYDPPPDVNCVDLDTNTVTVCEDRRYLTSKLLPKKSARILRANLEQSYRNLSALLYGRKNSTYHVDENVSENSIDKDFQSKRKELSLELEIQEAFLRFMAMILKGYRSYLLPIVKAPTVGATDTNSLFDLQGFLKSRDKAHSKFYNNMVRTQMFIRFIEERSFVSDMDAGLAFFDECTEKVDQDSGDSKLIELDDSHQSERTVFIMPPEPTGLPKDVTYSYPNGFVLDKSLYKVKEVKNHLSADHKSMAAMPGSPMARRTKYEIKLAQKLARKYAEHPDLWAKCLLTTCYSVWFIHLPSFALNVESKAATILLSAYDLLVKIQKTGLQPTDEVCYRVMMQLCGVHSQPVLAVKLLTLMKRSGIQPNAITYGFYNRAVLEAQWPSGMSNSSQILWNKLRNVVIGAAQFKHAGKMASKRRLSVSEDAGSSVVDVDGVSHTSMDSNNSQESANLLARIANPLNNGMTTTSSQSDTGYTSSCGDIHVPIKESDQTEPDISEGCLIDLDPATIDHPLAAETETLVTVNRPDYSSDALDAGSRSIVAPSDSIAFDKFRSRIGSIVRTSNLPLVCPRTAIKQESFKSSAGLLMTGGASLSIAEESQDLWDLEQFDAILNTPPPFARPCSRKARSGSCTEFSFSNMSPSSTHRRNTPAPSSPKHSPYDTSDCYKLLIRSESFANDAQILDNLKLLKQERVGYKSNLSNGDSVSMVAQKNLRNKHETCSKSLFNKHLNPSLKQLDEHPNSKSVDSSIENLGNISNFGSEDDVNVRTPKSKNAVLSNLENKLNKFKPDEWTRRQSVSSINEEKLETSNDSLNLSFNSSPIKSPIRTPVTENDPLGALSPTEEENKTLSEKTTEKREMPRVSSKIELDESGAPVLFDRRKGEWSNTTQSAIFSTRVESDEDGDEGDEEYEDDVSPLHRKSMHRSSTMPVDNMEEPADGSALKTGLSSFKIPFTTSGISTKKAESIMGGLHSLKTSVAKKFDEIKEAISANSTPIKTGSLSRDRDYYMNDDDLLQDTVNEESSFRRKISSEFSPLAMSQQSDYWSNFMELFGDGSRKGSTSNLQPYEESSLSNSQQNLIQEKLYPKVLRDPKIPVALEIVMTTCSRCHHCASVLYDEEIMAGWVSEDSNLNSKCQFCDKWTVPFLTLTINDHRGKKKMVAPVSSLLSLTASDKRSSLKRDSTTTMPESINTSVASLNSDVDEEITLPISSEPISVPYLNPIVLRKELESILYAEGDVCMTKPKFVDEHPIIYWNMIWIFERIAVPSHLPALCLNAECVLRNRESSAFHESWNACDQNNVLIRTMWDNTRLHDEVGLPMYVLWNQNDEQSSLVSALVTDRTTIPRSVMQAVITSVQLNNDLVEPLKRLAVERHKIRGRGVNRSHSLYREILFLTCVVCQRENIDQSVFDREYELAFRKLLEQDSKKYLRCDQPISKAAVKCRLYFKELEL
nr:PREDICTED: C-myc promoter-binding protein isoform X2 [Bemisia tabaci]